MPLRRIASFVALTIAITWSLWGAAFALEDSGSAGAATGALAHALFLLGVFTPAVVSSAIVATTGGRESLRALLGGIGRWRVGVGYYLFALILIPAAELTVAVTHRVVAGRWPPMGDTPWYLMLAVIPVSTLTQVGEEVGWRGWLLPRLAEWVGMRTASIVVGVVWASWHLPLFYFGAGDTAGQSFPLYLLQVAALSVVMAWLWARSGGSLLVVMLLHATVNNTKDIVQSATPGATQPMTFDASLAGWLTVIVLWAVAAACLVTMPSGTDRSRNRTLPFKAFANP